MNILQLHLFIVVLRSPTQHLVKQILKENCDFFLLWKTLFRNNTEKAFLWCFFSHRISVLTVPKWVLLLHLTIFFPSNRRFYLSNKFFVFFKIKLRDYGKIACNPLSKSMFSEKFWKCRINCATRYLNCKFWSKERPFFTIRLVLAYFGL